MDVIYNALNEMDIIDLLIYGLAILALLMCLCAYLLLILSMFGKDNNNDGKHDG